MNHLCSWGSHKVSTPDLRESPLFVQNVNTVIKVKDFFLSPNPFYLSVRRRKQEGWGSGTEALHSTSASQGWVCSEEPGR